MKKLFICFSILILAILVSILVIKDIASRRYYSEYERVLSEDGKDRESQLYYLKKALRFSPSNAKILFTLGQFYTMKPSSGKNQEEIHNPYMLARSFFQESLICLPTDGRNYAKFAWYKGYNGKTYEAINFFEKAVNLGWYDSYIHRLYGEWCVNEIKKKINFYNFNQFVGMYKNKQRRNAILKTYDDLFISGISVATFIKKAQIECGAVIALVSAGSISQRDYNIFADLCLLSCEIDKAIDKYQNAKNKFMQTICYFIKEDYDNVVRVSGDIISGEDALFRKHKYQTKRLLMDVIKHDPENSLAFYWLGRLYSRIGKNKKAIANFQKVVELDPKHIDTHMNLARIYKITGKSELVISEYETVLSINPEHKEATNLLSNAIREKYKDAEFIMK